MYHLSPISTRRPQYLSLSEGLVHSPSQLISANSAREKYLTALAEAKAAEAEYLAAEAVQREEEALLHRLEEIQLQKRHDELLRSRHRHSVLVTPSSQFLDDSIYSLGLDRYSSFDSQDRLALLRREVEEEELRRAATARRRQQEFDAEILRRKEIEEAKLLALKRKQEEEKLKKLARLREEEEARLRAIRLAQQVEQTRHIEDQGPKSVRLNFHIPSEQKPLKVSRPTTYYDVETLALPDQKRQCCKQPSQQRHEPKSTFNSKPADDGAQMFTNLLNMIAQVKAEASTGIPSKENVPDANLLNLLAQVKASASTGVPSKANVPEEQSGKEVPRKPTKEFVRFVFHPDHERKEIPAASTSRTDTKASTTQPKPTEPTAPATTLKEQLEERLNNDQSVEIRDTIQAILASLADSAFFPSSSSSEGAVPAAFSSKGKEKAPAPASVEVNPTSNDVAKSMDTVRNIEASFLALQDEFVFPPQLDFSPAPSPTSSPASSDTESTTATILKLAYTSRNHPVRYYEQALSGLLSQLDSVESFGNPDLRIKRKDVVGRVERALEELEREVEGRWRHKLAKDAKAAQEESGKQSSATVDISSPSTDTPTKSVPEATEPVTVNDSTENIKESNESAPTAAESNQMDGDNSSPQPTDTSSFPVDPASETGAPVSVECGSPKDDDVVVIEQEATEDSSAPEPELTVDLFSSTTEESATSISTESSISQSDEEDGGAKETDLSSSVMLTNTVPITPSYPPAPTSSYPPASLDVSGSSASSSVATVRPYDVDGRADEDVDTFLLPASSEDVPSKESKVEGDQQEADVGSDWSEVDA